MSRHPREVGTAGVRCMVMRGGTSKGAYFVADELPDDPDERDALLARVMGSPDPRQIDGIGGAHPLTSKVAVVSPSPDPGVDVDYLFLQVGVDDGSVSDRQNCGNLLGRCRAVRDRARAGHGQRSAGPGAHPHGEQRLDGDGLVPARRRSSRL